MHVGTQDQWLPLHFASFVLHTSRASLVCTAGSSSAAETPSQQRNEALLQRAKLHAVHAQLTTFCTPELQASLFAQASPLR